MDLRDIDWNPRELEVIQNHILRRRFIYQPFILGEDLEVGEGMNFFDGYRPGRTACVYWPGAPAALSAILTTDKDYFRRCNTQWRNHYEGYINSIVAMNGGDVSRLSFAEIGCNAGYFLFGLMRRGAARCVGFDYTQFAEIFAVLNQRLGTRVEFQRADWDSLEHRLAHADMPEVDVAITSAFLCHNPDPLYHLAYICDRARRGVFIWTPVANCAEEEPPFAHWKTDKIVTYGTPHRHTTDLLWPISFDYNIRLSAPLIHTCLREAGFEDIQELECPVQEPRWLEIHQGFRAFYARRTRNTKSLLSDPGARRSIKAGPLGQGQGGPASETEEVRSAPAKPIFREQWISFPQADAAFLTLLISNLRVERKRVLEVGSWLGTGSTAVLIKALQDGPGALYCVDTWRGSSNVERHAEFTKQYDAFATFMYNVEKNGGLDIVKPLLMSSREAAELVAEASLDLVFLDANHSYQSVAEDIRLWLPKVRPGGVFCGHDCEVRAEHVGVQFLRAHGDKDTVPASGVFNCIHPGSILAVHEAFGGRANLAAEHPLRLSDGRMARSSIWWVQRA